MVRIIKTDMRQEKTVAKITSINISPKKGTFKQPVSCAELRVDHGIVGDAHAGNWHRQISLLAQESIDKMTALGLDDLTPGKFAKITQIGKECHQHCEIYKKVGQCIMPHEGIFVRVLTPGTISTGDAVEIEA